MRSDSMLVFHEAEASEMADLFSQKATLVRDFIPDVNRAVIKAVDDWTGESRKAFAEALERLEKRGEELSKVLDEASKAMEDIKAAGNKAEAKAYVYVDG